MHDCFLIRALGLDPSLNLETGSDGSESECFMSCESAGSSWPAASDVDDDFYLLYVPLIILVFDRFVPVRTP